MRLGLVVVLFGLVGSACSFRELSSANRRIGVGPSGSSIEVWYLACPGENVEELTLWDLDDDKIARNEGDTVLWTATAEQLASQRISAVVPNDARGPIELEDDGHYYLNVESSQGGGSSDGFLVDDLEPGMVRVDRRVVTMEEFRANALKSCPA